MVGYGGEQVKAWAPLSVSLPIVPMTTKVYIKAIRLSLHKTL